LFERLLKARSCMSYDIISLRIGVAASDTSETCKPQVGYGLSILGAVPLIMENFHDALLPVRSNFPRTSPNPSPHPKPIRPVTQNLTSTCCEREPLGSVSQPANVARCSRGRTALTWKLVLHASACLASRRVHDQNSSAATRQVSLLPPYSTLCCSAGGQPGDPQHGQESSSVRGARGYDGGAVYGARARRRGAQRGGATAVSPLIPSSVFSVQTCSPMTKSISGCDASPCCNLPVTVSADASEQVLCGCWPVTHLRSAHRATHIRD